MTDEPTPENENEDVQPNEDTPPEEALIGNQSEQDVAEIELKEAEKAAESTDTE